MVPTSNKVNIYPVSVRDERQVLFAFRRFKPVFMVSLRFSFAVPLNEEPPDVMEMSCKVDGIGVKWTTRIGSAP